jgi:FtsP/CotA-like multicopper oxidase with cupredoxin domain
MRKTRREFLIASAYLGAGFWVAGCGSSSFSPPLGQTAPLPLTVQPPVIASQNGVLQTTLRCVCTENTLNNGRRAYTRTYNEALVGPTLKIRPGDTLKIEIQNDLPVSEFDDPLCGPGAPTIDSNTPNSFNTTNFHVHGLHVSPVGIGDNVLRDMEPGTSSPVEIQVPHDHPGGTNWYHPHRHGSASMQMFGGMMGALVIESELDRQADVSAAVDLVMVMSELRLTVQGTTPPVFSLSAFAGATPTSLITVNGEVNPTVRMRPGEVQRWRLVQGCVSNFALLRLQGHRFLVIAKDGLTYPEPVWQEEILMVPGERYDVLVKAGRPGTYPLIKEDDRLVNPELTILGTVLTVQVSGESLDMNLPNGPLPGGQRDMIDDDEIVRRRQIVFDVQPSPEGEPLFLIDGKLFDHDRIDHSFQLGTAEEWTILNRNNNFGHPFHTHTNDLVLTHVNGRVLEQPVWCDTVLVPPPLPDGTPGSITLRTRFEDFTGKGVIHCHIIDHEDLGMMQLWEIV